MNNSLYATTIFFGSQISSALAYLESLHIYHRDIAARNCLVSLDLTIKLHDLAMCNEIYTDDYVLVTVGNDIQTRRPIRWCAWETICLVSLVVVFFCFVIDELKLQILESIYIKI